MAAPDYFIKSLIRVARAQGRGVLLAIVTSQFQIVKDSGGKTLTGATANGKSFSYTIPSGLALDSLMAKAEEALEWFDGSTTAQVDAMLATRPTSVTVGRPRGDRGFYY